MDSGTSRRGAQPAVAISRRPGEGATERRGALIALCIVAVLDRCKSPVEDNRASVGPCGFRVWSHGLPVAVSDGGCFGWWLFRMGVRTTLKGVMPRAEYRVDGAESAQQ